MHEWAWASAELLNVDDAFSLMWWSFLALVNVILHIDAEMHGTDKMNERTCVGCRCSHYQRREFSTTHAGISAVCTSYISGSVVIEQLMPSLPNNALASPLSPTSQLVRLYVVTCCMMHTLNQQYTIGILYSSEFWQQHLVRLWQCRWLVNGMMETADLTLRWVTFMITIGARSMMSSVIHLRFFGSVIQLI